MKRLICALLLAYNIGLTSLSGETAETPVNSAVRESILNCLCPQPKEAEFFEGLYLLNSKSTVEIFTPKELSKAEKATLESLSYTLALIFLQNHKVKRYELSEEPSSEAAEPLAVYKRNSIDAVNKSNKNEYK